MEAIIIIIVVLGIVGYVIYINQTSTKFNKANKLLNQNKFDEAQLIYKQIVSKHSYAVAKYAECFFLQGNALKVENRVKEAINFYNKTLDSKSLLNSKSDKKSYLDIEKQAYFEIATLQFKNIYNNKNKETINAYKKNINYIKRTGYSKLQNFISLIEEHHQRIIDTYYEITESQFNSISSNKDARTIELYKDNIAYIKNLGYDNIKKFNDLIKRHYIEIAKTYYEIGLKNEKNQNLIEAKRNYSIVIGLTLQKFNKNQTYYNAIARIEICKIKLNEDIDKNNFNDINKSQKVFQTDFYYRYSIHLLKKKEFKEAEKIIDSKLDAKNTEIRSLKEVCSNEKIKSAISKISNVNNQIKNIYSKSSSLEDLLSLYNSISEKAKDLDKVIPGIQKELEALKPSLFNRVLQNYTEQEEYEKIINLITEFPNFYEYPILLKNLGSSCFNYLSKNSLTENNYKLLISSFLTSTYTDNAILYSLEENLWDDEYTFTLTDSIGSAYKIHSHLPENVNYDEVSETNISIGESQRFLISQFEYLLNNQDINSNFAEEVQSFYASEKEAIESIISIIPNEIIFATPYFAQLFNLQNKILSELENNYKEYENEESLKVGIAYDKGNINSTIAEFSLAKNILENILNSIKEVDKVSFIKYTSIKNVKILKKYSSIYNDLEINLADAFDVSIKKYSENKDILDILDIAIKFSPTKDKLKYQFANYAANYCVSKINAGKMSNLEGLQIMHKAYKLLPNDSRVCTNIITLIRMNILDILNERTFNSSKIYSILDDIKNNKSNSFKHNAGELVKARNEILNQLPTEAQAVIASGVNLNANGKQLKKGLDCLASLGGLSIADDPLSATLKRLLKDNPDLLMPSKPRIQPF